MIKKNNIYYLKFSFFTWLIFLINGYAQVSVSKPILKFTKACASATFNSFDFAFTVSNPQEAGAGNVFIVEMSNATGSFTAPTVVKTVTGAGSAFDPVSFALPLTAYGAGYRIRVRSTVPATTSPVSAAFPAYYAIHNQPFSINNNNGTVQICQGNSYTLSIDNTGTPLSPTYYPALTYKWFKDLTVIPGATGPSITVTQAGKYYVYTEYGACTEYMFSYSNDVNVAVQAVLTPVITTTSTSLCPAGTRTLTSSVQTAGYTYVWYRDNAVIPGANTPNYTASQEGLYHLQITGGGCVFETNAIELDAVDFNLSIDPSATTILIPGDQVNIAAITDAVSPTYKWYKNNGIIPGAAGVSYNVTQKGTYKVEVNEPAPCNITKEAAVTVLYPDHFDLKIQLTPDYQACVSTVANLKINVFDAITGSNIVSILGNTYNYSYKWYKDNVLLAGATTNQLSITDPSKSGFYKLEVTIPDFGVVTSNAIEVKLSFGDVTITGATLICEGAIVALTSNITGNDYDYQWYKNGAALPAITTPTLAADSEGDYYLTVTNGNCSDQSNTIHIDKAVINVSSVSPVLDLILPGQTKTLTVTTDAVLPQYKWYRNNILLAATTTTLTATQNGVYKVVVTQTSGCNATAEKTFTLEYPTGFTLAIANGAYTACTSTTATLNIASFVALTSNGNVDVSAMGYQYQWYKNNVVVIGATSATLTLTNASQNGDYKLRVTIPDFTPVTSNIITINLAMPAVTISGSSILCAGGTVALSSDITVLEYTYQWFKNGAPVIGAITSSYTANAAGDYYLEITGGVCAKQSNTIQVTTAQITVSSTNPAIDIILPGQSKPLSVTTTAAAPQYKWYRNGILLAETTATLTATQNGTYKVEVLQTSGCNAAAEKTFTLNYPTGFDITIANGAYTACVNTTATLNIASFVALTSNGNVDVTGMGYQYQWYRNNVAVAGATSATLTLTNASQNGDYKLRVTIPDFTPVTSNIITINLAMPAVTISGSSILCAGGTVALSSDITAAEYAYQWFKNGAPVIGAITSSYTANAAGDYYLEITGGVCAKQSNTIQVTTAQITVSSTNPAVDIILPGQSKPLSVTTTAAAPQYKWYRNTILQTETTATFTAIQSGIYKVEVLQTSGCNAAAEKTFTLEYPTGFTATIANGAYTACTSTTATLNIASFVALTSNGNIDVTGMGYQYQWYRNNVAVAGATSATLSLTNAVQNGDYKLMVTIPDFTPVTSNTIAINLAIGNIVITNNSALCAGSTVAISSSVAGPNYTYQWFKNTVAIPGETASTLTANAEGDYYLVVTSGTCTAQSNTVHLQLSAITINSTNPAVDVILPGQNKILTVTTDAAVPQYTWHRNNGVLTETSASLTATQDGEYKVVVLQTAGCNATAEKTFTLNYPTGFTITVAATSGYTACTSTTATLDITSFVALTPNGTIDVTAMGYQYQWYKNNVAVAGATSAVLSITDASQNGDYRLGVTIPGFAAVTSNTITINLAMPAVTISGSTTLCTGGVSVLSSSITSPLYTYQWFKNTIALGGATASTLTASAEGDYYVVVTGGVCTSQSNTIHITTAQITIGSTNPAVAVILPGQTKIFTVTTNAASPQYTWYRNNILLAETSATLSTTQDGIYKVVVMQTVGCNATAEKTFTLNYPNAFQIIIGSGGYAACTSLTATLDITFFVALTTSGNVDVTTMGYQYQWFKNDIAIPGETSGVLSLTSALQNGNYKLGVTIPGFAPITSNVITIDLGLEPVTISGDTILCAGGTVSLSANVTDAAYSYQWYKGNTPLANTFSPVLIADAADEYYIVVTGGNCTIQSNTIQVTEAEIAITTTNPAVDVILPGQTKILTVTTDAASPEYTWYRNTIALAETSASLTATQDGEYKVEVLQTAGCSVTAETTFTLEYPTGFTVGIGVNAGYVNCTSTTATLDITTFTAQTVVGDINVLVTDYIYQWYKNDVPVAGATSAVLFLDNASQNGEYKMGITIPGYAEVFSNPITVNLSIGPVTITASGDLCVNNPQVVISNSFADTSYTYTWFKGGVEINAATNPDYSVTEAGSYYVTVSKDGCTFTSNTVTVSAIDFTLTSANPLIDIIIQGDNKVLTVTTDALQPSYEWYRNNILLTGETEASLTAVQDGVYKVIVTQNDACTMVKELVLELVYPTGFTMVIAPQAYEECVSTQTTLAITEFNAITQNGLVDIVGNSFNYGYQWYKGNEIIAGATSATLQVAQSGTYTLQITIPDFGIITSNTVVIKMAFVNGVTISTDDVFCSENASVTIKSNVVNQAYTYLWYHDGSPITQTGAVITVTDKGSYRLEVSYDGCTIASNVLELVPYDMSQVVINVESEMSLPEGTSITVTASGAEKYEWYFNGKLVSIVASLTITQPGTYSVTATVGECEVTKEFVVGLKENHLLAIPNVVTPNNDGINDQWALPLKYLNETTEIVIYGPDGSIVFRAMHYNNDWPKSDFTYSLKSPVYYYTIMENNKITRRGSITFVK